MENQHRKISGYRELSQEEIKLMNEIKSRGAAIGELVKKLEVIQKAEAEHLNVGQDEDFTDRVDTLLDARRWTAIGKNQVQQGLMALTRAVARPTLF